MKHTFVVIGASSGIGEEISELLSSKGHSVYGSYNTHFKEDSNNKIFFHYDVNSGSNDLSIIPDNIDGIVYCPGSINLKPFSRISPDKFVDDFKLQVVGAIEIIQKLLPNLKNSNNASILLFSTVAVQLGFPFHTQVAASKGAIEGLTKSLAAELAPKIRVNCIAPSLTDTPLASTLLNSEDKRKANADRHPLKRVGNKNDIASAAEFLLSDKSSWVSGQILHIDGGMSSIKI